ncbi:MAG: ArsR family transcriptional regulator [Acidobacteria bacterium]|nr:MAG: ArsR family transcriptional regulator [Acidobacteriota bacterium]
MKLSPVMQKFILHWGEMGTRWGINRTVAQIHALLYISNEPLTAEEIAETLQVARSNVSNSLRELQSWGIVKVAHKMGDRRDHFESMKDMWEMFQVIMNERKRRELDPTLAVLRECVAQLDKPSASEAYAKERLVKLLDFVETVNNFYEQIRKMPGNLMIKFLKSADRVRKVLNVVSE